MSVFSETLKKLREEAGYTSVRAFYLKRGGVRYFQCTYRQYYNVEKGVQLPNPILTQKIAAALHLASEPERARRFSTAYLKAMCGDDRLYQLMLQSLPISSLEKKDRFPLARTMANKVRSNTVVLTSEQAQTMYASGENIWVLAVLQCDAGHWSPDRLSETLKMPRPTVDKALKQLLKQKLVAKDKKGDYYYPNHGRPIAFPNTELYQPDLKVVREKYMEMLRKRNGKSLRNFVLLRASKSALLQYLPHLRDALEGAMLCATDKEGEDTGFHLVEVGVHDIFQF